MSDENETLPVEHGAAPTQADKPQKGAFEMLTEISRRANQYYPKPLWGSTLFAAQSEAFGGPLLNFLNTRPAWADVGTSFQFKISALDWLSQWSEWMEEADEHLRQEMEDLKRQLENLLKRMQHFNEKHGIITPTDEDDFWGWFLDRYCEGIGWNEPLPKVEPKHLRAFHDENERNWNEAPASLAAPDAQPADLPAPLYLDGNLNGLIYFFVELRERKALTATTENIAQWLKLMFANYENTEVKNIDGTLRQKPYPKRGKLHPMFLDEAADQIKPK